MNPALLVMARAVAAGGFTPADLPNLKFWYDASDAGSFTYSSGTSVSQWNDLSGNGLHLTQSTASNQPSRSGTQNGHDTVIFDGGDWLENLGNLSFGGDAASAFVVARFASASSASAGFITMKDSGGVDDSNNVASARFLARQSGTTTLRAQRNGTKSTKVASYDTWFCAFSIFDAANHTLYLDGTAGTAVASTGTFSAEDIRMGATFQSGTTEKLNGHIAEVAVCAAAWGSTERADLLAYAQTKWGTP